MDEQQVAVSQQQRTHRHYQEAGNDDFGLYLQEEEGKAKVAGCHGHRNQCEGVDVFTAESAGNRSQSESEHRQRQGRFSAGDDQGHFRVIQILDDAEGRQYRDAQ